MDSPNSTSNKVRAPAPSNGPFNHSTEAAFPFLQLPAELRNRIYRIVLSNNTIHLEGTRANLANKYKLVFKTCTAPTIDYNLLENLSAAPEGHTTATSADHTKWEPCDSSLFEFGESVCPHGSGVNIDIQLLCVCRQIHHEAAMIPYAENRFHFSSGLQPMLCDDLTKRFTIEQLHAVKTVAVLGSDTSMRHLRHLVQLFPQLIKLWLQCNSHITRLEETAHKLFYSQDSCRLEVIIVMSKIKEEEFGGEKTWFEDNLKPKIFEAFEMLDDVDCVVKWYPSDWS